LGPERTHLPHHLGLVDTAASRTGRLSPACRRASRLLSRLELTTPGLRAGHHCLCCWGCVAAAAPTASAAICRAWRPSRGWRGTCCHGGIRFWLQRCIWLCACLLPLLLLLLLLLPMLSALGCLGFNRRCLGLATKLMLLLGLAPVCCWLLLLLLLRVLLRERQRLFLQQHSLLLLLLMLPQLLSPLLVVLLIRTQLLLFLLLSLLLMPLLKLWHQRECLLL
jgi:hypothetical protein